MLESMSLWKGSSVCIVDATGTIVREVKIASEPAVLVQYFDELELPVGGELIAQ
jgi:transposase